MNTTQFKDSKGKVWDLKLNLGKVLRVDRSDFSIYTKNPVILSKYDRDTIMEILTETSLMFAIIGVVVRDQGKENLGDDTTDENFDERFASVIDGPCIETARDAFVDALGDFFPTAKTALSTFLQKIREYQKKTMEKLDKLIPMMDQKVDQAIEEEFNKVRKTLNETSSRTLPFSESLALNGNSSLSES